MAKHELAIAMATFGAIFLAWGVVSIKWLGHRIQNSEDRIYGD